MKNTMKLNFVQNIAAPHNNVLIKAMHEEEKLDFELWYAQSSDILYKWKTDLRHEIKQANDYESKKIDFAFLKECLFSKRKLLMVGWVNNNQRLLLPLLWLTRRPFNMWFDLPQDEFKRSGLKNLIRKFYYWLLKTSNSKIFCVGKMTVEYFKNRGFAEDRLVNLPIFIEVDDYTQFQNRRDEVCKKYNVKDGDIFLTSGSRLIYDKGYDILIDAIAALPEDVKKRVKCVIVGQGEEEDNLKNQIVKLKLSEQVIMESWLEIDDFRALLANSDVFIHPCRFDAFGGTIYGMSLGVPVIGSTGAGAALDRIEHGKNGYLFENENIAECAKYIEHVANNMEELPEMAAAARKTAEKWHPSYGVEILMKELI